MMENVEYLKTYKDDLCCKRLLHQLQIEFKEHDRKGIYAWVQKRLAYSSNRIEGSTLTADQTSDLFDTGTIRGEEYRARDVEEANGHFLMFNYMLKTINEPLTIDMIKKFHQELKQGVFVDRANGYAIGDWKTRPNIAGSEDTCKPQEVQQAMEKLLSVSCYDTLSSIAKFHADFEKIHPFQDGNGRVGRLLIFRQCCVNNIIPVIIDDNKRARYIEAIRLAHTGNISDLAKLFVECQSEMRDRLKYFNLL